MPSPIVTLVQSRTDPTGAAVEEIYDTVDGSYAVYRSKGLVRMQFADDPATALLQRKALAPVETLRAQTLALLANWREARRWMWPDVRDARGEVYNQRIADALVAGLGGFPDITRSILEAVRDSLTAEMQSVRRMQYLTMAMASLAACGLVVFVLNEIPLRDIGAFFEEQGVLFAASTGMIGAMFSIGLGLRQKTLQANSLLRDNFVEASLRITIGGISAVVLFALIQSGIVALNFGGKPLSILDAGTGKLTPFALIVGIVAGFSERLVGNFLESISLEKRPAPAPSVDAAADAAAAAKQVREGQTVLVPLPDPTTSPAPASPEPPAPHPEDHLDGCACDAPGPTETTDDTELPPARGGVA